MAWVAGRAIRFNRVFWPVGAVVEAVMAGLAEATESAEPEGGVITFVVLNVISDRRWRHTAHLQADPAQRLYS